MGGEMTEMGAPPFAEVNERVAISVTKEGNNCLNKV
jgi:hypothetical protein